MEIKKEKNYTKRIVVLCFLMVMVSLGLCSSGRTMYLTAICDALNLQRGAFSIGNTFRYVTTAVLNLFFGQMVLKFGTKKLVFFGFLSLLIFAGINIFATQLIEFYISNIFLGIGLCWCSTTMASAIVNRTCTENKGKIMGAVLSANGIGGAIAAQVLSPIIFAEGKPFGYRTSYMVVFAVLAITMALVMIFYKEAPKKEGEEFVKKKKKRGAGWVGMEYSDVIKKPYFYVTVLCVFLTGIAITGIGGIALPHMYDVGLSKAYVATLSSIASIMLTFTKFSTGVTYDKFGTRTAMNVCYTSLIISLLGLIIVSNTPFGRGVAFVRSFIASFATPLETVMIPFFASEIFGDKSFEKTLGVLMAAKYTGDAVGNPFGNILYDFFGNYNLAFVIFSIIAVLVVISMQFVLTAAHKDRKIILAKEEV